jgi:tetratricopeptide (TPR) repeat protein
MFIYPRWELDPNQWWQYLFPFATAALLITLVWLARKHRGPLAAALIFVGTLFPVLGFLNVYPFRYSYVADHFQYLAILAILIPLAGALTAWTPRTALPFFLLLPLAYATWHQNDTYRDYETLFRATLARNPNSALVHNNLGVMLMSSGRESEAVTAFDAAVRLKPNDPDYRVNLGLALAQVPGRLPDAIVQYQVALRASPNLAAAHLNLGLAYTSIPGRLQDAIAEYQQAIATYQPAARSNTGGWEAHFNLGLAYAQIPGKETEAIAEYQIALRRKPDSALTHFHLGNAFHKLGRLPEAIAAYQASVNIDPAVPEVHYELAYALAQIPGRVPEAIAECRKMLQLKPGDEHGQQLMASLLEFQRSPR